MLLRKMIFLVFIAVSFSYAVFTAKGVLFSPRLKIFSPKDGSKIIGTRIHFLGKTIPNSTLWIDGARAESNKNGFFEEFLTFHPGYNEVGISIKNRFGKETKKVLKFVVE